MTRINFFDDPNEAPRSREDVKFRQLGLYLHEDRQRVAVGFDITPFLERPSIEVIITNENGVEAASMHVIETLETNFSLTMHLRDPAPTDAYQVKATLYYATPETARVNVHTVTRKLDRTKIGQQ